jgi:hypothetical protein
LPKRVTDDAEVGYFNDDMLFRGIGSGNPAFSGRILAILQAIENEPTDIQFVV